ncbi:MAG TPA: hypothetical protein VN081_00830 [Dongiaceae bacterium]|nr:hypothetical protein [Dongiaceae bacterium]
MAISATSLINQVNSVLTQVTPLARTVYLRTVSVSGGDSLIGKVGTSSYTDTLLSPQPYFTRIGREHVPGGHADFYDYIDNNGRQMLRDDYRFIFSPTSVTRDQLENPNNIFALKDSDGNTELLRLVDIEAPAVAGSEVLFVCYLRSVGEVPGAVTIGFSASTTVAVNHNMNSAAIVPFVSDVTGMPLAYSDFTIVDLNNATLTFSIPESGSVVVKTAVTLGAYVATFTTGDPDGNGHYELPLNHNLGTTQIAACVYNNSSHQVIQYGSIAAVDEDNAIVTFTVSESGTVIVYPQ